MPTGAAPVGISIKVSFLNSTSEEDIPSSAPHLSNKNVANLRTICKPLARQKNVVYRLFPAVIGLRVSRSPVNVSYNNHTQHHHNAEGPQGCFRPEPDDKSVQIDNEEGSPEPD